jgi:hypothetical protein
VHLTFTTITRPMVEENTLSLQATQGPSLDELGLAPDEQKRLEQLGVKNASQLDRLQKTAGTGTIRRFARVPLDHLRVALQRGKPTLGNVSIVQPTPEGRPPTAPPPPVQPQAPINTRPGIEPGPRKTIPLPDRLAPEKVLPATRVRLEGRNLLGAGPPRALYNDQPVPLASAEEDAIEIVVPDTAGALTLELGDGSVHRIPLGPAGATDPWGSA